MSDFLTSQEHNFSLAQISSSNEEIHQDSLLYELLNPQQLNFPNQNDQAAPEHQFLDWSIWQSLNSYDISSSSDNQSILNFDETEQEKKKGRGAQNSIPSNLARQFLTRIHIDLKFNKDSLKRIDKFIRENKINRQRWVIDAIFLVLIFQRDIKASITPLQFKIIIGNFLEQILLKKKRTDVQKNKKLFQIYINHVKEYEKEEFQFDNYDTIKGQCRRFYSDIVLKRKIYVENYLKVLKKMHDTLREKENIPNKLEI